MMGFQARVNEWLIACFGIDIARDPVERNHRFLEEALELVQACGCTGSEAHQLVDYTFGHPVGERGQEVGGVMNTLAALCLAHGLDMADEGDREIARCWEKIERIREKQRNKPKHSPLPMTAPTDALIEGPKGVRDALEYLENAYSPDAALRRAVNLLIRDYRVLLARVEGLDRERDEFTIERAIGQRQVESLLARIEAAEKVIQPFADVAETIDDVGREHEDDDRIWVVQAYGCKLAEFTEDHFRAAAQWQAGQEGEG